VAYLVQALSAHHHTMIFIQTVNPKVEVAVKLVASQGIGTIAVGVVKAGADVINIASHSGGTGAAQQSSIKHAGLPGELGLLEVDSALRTAKLRDLVKLRTSGGIKTAEDILISAIMGADQFELGTTSMLMLGCKMQRTCNKSCQPGVATDGHLFKGDQMHVERFFVNMAAVLQNQLSYLGVSCLSLLKGRTDLMALVASEYTHQYDFSMFFQDKSGYPKLSALQISQAILKRQQKFSHAKERQLIAEIKQFFQEQPNGKFRSPIIELDCGDLSFGAGIAGCMVHHLEQYPQAEIILNTKGLAGESFAFVLPAGMHIHHQGSVQDGAGKSMTGGELIIRSAFEDSVDFSIGGNSILYGANGGKVFIQGKVGHRFGILNKGAVAVVEGAGDLALEYMTAGTVLILGDVGRDMATGSSGGVIIVWDPKGQLQASTDVEQQPTQAYSGVIHKLLQQHVDKTGSSVAKSILENVQLDAFRVLTPVALNQIQTAEQLMGVIQTYELRAQLLCLGMKVWLEQKILSYFSYPEHPDKQAFLQFLIQTKQRYVSASVMAKCHYFARQEVQKELKSQQQNSHVMFQPAVQLIRPVLKRVSSILGELDTQLLDALKHIKAYAAQLLHDASGCSGCKAQSCASGHESDFGCPSGKPINSINYHLKRLEHLKLDGVLGGAEWLDLRKAFELQIQESPFIAYTGAACPAPCQDACTESIPNMDNMQTSRAGKPVGEPVHIKNIEFYLFQIGRSLGWFDGKKVWTAEEIDWVFGSNEYKQHHYDPIMQQFEPPFQVASQKRTQELIIVGSGPAAMQMAYEGLRDGLQVRMYEKSDKPGGLLMDGIPAHKFSKDYIIEDFDYLQGMGLSLHLNAEVTFDKQQQRLLVQQQVIAELDNPNQMIAFCIGSGKPKSLSSQLTQQLDVVSNNKIVQAVDFLKAANDIAREIKLKGAEIEIESLIQQKFGSMDPRDKKIVVVGGGDTAQDVIRWLVRYFQQTQGELNMLLRGPLPETSRGIIDAYPHASKAMTSEHHLRHEELQIINSTISERTDILNIEVNASDKLRIDVSQQHYQYESYISSQPDVRRFFSELPREKRPVDQSRRVVSRIDDVDMIICALGFENIQELHPTLFNSGRVCFAGDTALHTQKIIVAAQANAKNTYNGHLRKLIIQVKPQALPFFSAANVMTPHVGAPKSKDLSF
jgi:glutamate synthase domain-containing protein 3/NADPH-dependent glutamate synthase beta subunit-like oxidoreductase